MFELTNHVNDLTPARFLGLHEETKIPNDCSSALSVISQRMEQRMAYGQSEQVRLIILHLGYISCIAE